PGVVRAAAWLPNPGRRDGCLRRGAGWAALDRALPACIASSRARARRRALAAPRPGWSGGAVRERVRARLALAGAQRRPPADAVRRVGWPRPAAAQHLGQGRVSQLMNELWSELVTTAMLGVERRALALPTTDGALGEVLRQLDLADREGMLLGAAATVALARRAGRLPLQRAPTHTIPAGEDDLPLCPPRAVQHLTALLGGGHQRALLPEWLAALAATGRRVPPAQLPALLDLGRTQPD